MSLINSIPEYNLLEFEEFEDYEKNELVIGVIDDLKLFFLVDVKKQKKIHIIVLTKQDLRTFLKDILNLKAQIKKKKNFLLKHN